MSIHRIYCAIAVPDSISGRVSYNLLYRLWGSQGWNFGRLKIISMSNRHQLQHMVHLRVGRLSANEIMIATSPFTTDTGIEISNNKHLNTKMGVENLLGASHFKYALLPLSSLTNDLMHTYVKSIAFSLVPRPSPHPCLFQRSVGHRGTSGVCRKPWKGRL
jgi:hypothetical protein